MNLISRRLWGGRVGEWEGFAIDYEGARRGVIGYDKELNEYEKDYS